MSLGNVTVLPAAGLASRMRGLPKFLLPCTDQYETLIERHIRLSLPVSDLVCVVTRPQYAPLLSSLGIFRDNVILSVAETETMNATVRGITDWVHADRYTIIMPDTFFAGEAPHDYLASSSSALNLALWKIRANQRGKLGQVDLDHDGAVVGHLDKQPNCDFPYSWGAMSFTTEVAELLQPSDPHVGYIIDPALRGRAQVGAKVMAGEYFDCGTPSEFHSLVATKWRSP